MDLSACAAEINKAALEAEARASQIETTLSAERIATFSKKLPCKPLVLGLHWLKPSVLGKPTMAGHLARLDRSDESSPIIKDLTRAGLGGW